MFFIYSIPLNLFCFLQMETYEKTFTVDEYGMSSYTACYKIYTIFNSMSSYIASLYVFFCKI